VAFVYDPQRDAFKTIRGFVYQADLTVRRWISLPADHVLQLERGEDIDIVATAISSGEEMQRIVEQVKSRQKSVTLRSRATIEAVGNFALHRERNPNLKLLFRFATNAVAGREKKMPFPGARSGIAAWSRLHDQAINNDERSAIANALRVFYRASKKKPKDVPADAWAALHRVVDKASEEEWLDFLMSFEWSTGNTQPSAMEEVIQRDLVALGFSRDAAEAAEHQRRLFAYVVRLLTQQGEKRLTAADLPKVLSSPADPEIDRHIATLLDRMAGMEGRVDAVETRVAVLEGYVSAESLAAATEAITAHIKWSRETYSTFHSVALERSLPSSTAWDRVRYETEDNDRKAATAEEVLTRERFLLLTGGAGAGKSTLCLRLAHAAAERDEIALRVSLRDVLRHLVDGKTFAQAIADLVPSLPLEDRIGCAAIVGNLNVLLADGFDECGSNRDLVSGKLLEWSRAHEHCRIVVTSRPSAVESGSLPGFVRAELRALESNEARMIADQLLHLMEREDIAAVWERLETVLPRWLGRARTRLGDAVRNPLLLSFIVVLAAEDVALDGTRAEVYAKVVEAMRQRGRRDRVADSEPPEAIGRFVFDALGWHLLLDPAADLAVLRRSIAPELAQAAGLPPLAAETKFDDAVAFWRARGVLDRAGGIATETVVFVHQSLAEFGAGRRVAAFSSAQLREWVELTVGDPASSSEVMLFAAGVGRANEIAAILLDSEPDTWSARPLLAARILAETETPDENLVDTVVTHLAERVASPVPIIAIEAGLALERLATVTATPVIAALRPLLDSEQEWTRLAALAPMLAGDPAAVPAEAAEKWLSGLRLVPRIFAGDQWTQERDLPYAAADLQESALPRAALVVAQRSTKESAHRTFEQLMSSGLRDTDTREQVGRILREHGFAEIEERHRVDYGSAWRSTLALLERDRPHELEFLDELAMALDLPANDSGPPAEGLPNLSRVIRVLHVDWFRLAMSPDERDVLRAVLRGIAAATAVDPAALARELATARERISSGDARNVYDMIGDYEDSPEWHVGAAVVEAPMLFRGLTHRSNGVKNAAVNLAANKNLGEEELMDGFREALTSGHSTTLDLIAQVALEILPPDRSVDLFAERLVGRRTRGCSYLYEALGKLHARASIESQKKIRATIAEGLTGEIPDAAAAAAGVASLFVPDDARVVAAVLKAFDYWSIDRGNCSYCETPLKGTSCPKCNIGVRHPRPIFLRLRDRVERVHVPELLALMSTGMYDEREVALDLLKTRIAEDDAELAQAIAILSDDSAIPRLAARLRAIRAVLELPSERIAPHAAALTALYDSSMPQVRAEFVKAVTSQWLDEKRVTEYIDRGLNDPAPSVRSAAAGVARRVHTASAASVFIDDDD
jgi:KaiC/GvpD/RAD55 family RecA-like ATPase